MKRLPLLMNVIAVAALSASLAYWALQWFKLPPRPLAAVAVSSAPEVNVEAATGLFGGQSSSVTASNYQLTGVIAAANGRSSVAIMALDGKPAQAFAVGAEVAPGVTVKEVKPRYVVLSDGGVLKRIELPAEGKTSAAPAAPTPSLLAPLAPQLAPSSRVMSMPPMPTPPPAQGPRPPVQ